MLSLYQYLPTQQRRLITLILAGTVLALWSLCLPPTPFEVIDLPRPRVVPISNKPDNPISELDSLSMTAWNIPIIVVKPTIPLTKPKMLTTPKVNRKMIIESPPVLATPMPVVYPPLPPPIVKLPTITYLGQVNDQQGTQVFFTLGDTNVMMRLNYVYGKTWQIIEISKDEVKIRHLPTQQIIRVSKS